MRVHRAPEPRIPVVLATGLLAAIAGWVLVRATIGRTPDAGRPASEAAENVAFDGRDDEAEEPARLAEATPTEADPSEADPTEADPTEAAPTEATPAAAPSEVTPTEAAPTEAPTEAAPPPSAGPSGSSEVTVRRGRVAYIRCGDTERCPRDAALEDAAWAILESLPSCARLAGQAGSADVRFHFEADTAEVRFRDHGDRPLSIPALRACLVGPSASLRTALTPRPLTASFRFDLVAD